VFTLGVLLLFATITRFEPSVVRASVMTAVAAVGSLVGAEVSSRRVLALAISGLVLLDPLIVHSVAFQLSVAASAGILLWSGRVARAVPGPRVLVEALAVTATAQLAVAPLLVWRFDGLPVASLPANLLAGPAAGPVMMWGLTAGLVAGFVPGWAAGLLHLPTRLGLWWIDGVASYAPRSPLGELVAVHVGVLFVAGWFGLRSILSRRRVAALAIVVATLLHPALAMAGRAPTTVSLDRESVLWRDDSYAILELSATAGAEDVLRELRRSGVGRLDLVIAERSSFSTAALIGWISQRHEIGVVWAPAQTMGVGEHLPQEDARLVIGDSVLRIVIVDGRLEVSPTG
jgi:competence protein ComEC